MWFSTNFGKYQSSKCDVKKKIICIKSCESCKRVQSTVLRLPDQKQSSNLSVNLSASSELEANGKATIEKQNFLWQVKCLFGLEHVAFYRLIGSSKPFQFAIESVSIYSCGFVIMRDRNSITWHSISVNHENKTVISTNSCKIMAVLSWIERVVKPQRSDNAAVMQSWIVCDI